RQVVPPRVEHRTARPCRGRGDRAIRPRARPGMSSIEDRLARRLRDALGPHAVFCATEDVIMYEYDYGLDRRMPDLVALPRSTAEVQTIVRLAQAEGVPIVARGAGTGIS